MFIWRYLDEMFLYLFGYIEVFFVFEVCVLNEFYLILIFNFLFRVVISIVVCCGLWFVFIVIFFLFFIVFYGLFFFFIFV